jgi:hypothetical protein
MANKRTVFDRETLDTIADLYAITKPYADVLGIDEARHTRLPK